MKPLIVAAYFFSVGYVVSKSGYDKIIVRGVLDVWDELNRRSAAQFLDEAARRNFPVRASRAATPD
jgi:hypothetical protein